MIPVTGYDHKNKTKNKRKTVKTSEMWSTREKWDQGHLSTFLCENKNKIIIKTKSDKTLKQ